MRVGVLVAARSGFAMVENGIRVFFFSSRRRHTRFDCDWSSDVCSSDLYNAAARMSEPAKSLSPSDALRFRPADLGDVGALVRLINSAFRVEQPFIAGDRDRKSVV